MLKRNWNQVIFDEFFFYEYSRCQFRAACMANPKLVRNQYCPKAEKIKPIRVKGYHYHDDTLKYLILKKILFTLVNTLINKDSVNLNWFKKTSALIIEKEISSISKKAHNRKLKYFENIKEQIANQLENLFSLVDTEDFTNTLEDTLILKINLEEYITSLKSRLSKHTLSVIPDFDFSKGFPIFKHEILSVNYNQQEESLSLVISSIFEITDNMVHRNFILNILFNYYYYFIKNELSKKYSINIKFMNKITVYNPLQNKKSIVYFEDLKGTLSELDLFRIMKTYIDNNTARTLNTSNCLFCENKEFCEIRTRSNNKEAIKAVLRSKEGKNNLLELI